MGITPGPDTYRGERDALLTLRMFNISNQTDLQRSMTTWSTVLKKMWRKCGWIFSENMIGATIIFYENEIGATIIFYENEIGLP